MENQIIQGRLAALRLAMKEAGVDFYMMPTADFHNSEYVSDYFKVREYFCGFTGSNGDLLLWQEGAGLWTDGRYFIQAERELEGTGVTLFRMLDEGVPTLTEFLKEHIKDGQTFGFDGRVVSAREGRQFEKALAGKQVRICCDRDLAGEVWKDRPALPCGPVRVLPGEIAGRSLEEKREQVRREMEKQEAGGFLLSKLDDIMWLLNIRGCDVECNPVALSYLYLTEKETVLFIQGRALNREAEAYLASKGVTCREYGEVLPFLESLEKGSRVLVDGNCVSYALFKALEKRGEPVEKKNPTELLKAVKSPEELAHMEEIYLKDSAALTKFIYWLKTHIGREEITEISAADYLEGLRRQIPEFLDLSFPTIAAYEANAAMMHYEAVPESFAVLRPEGMLLVDSGGQYLGGTTDVTRTIVLGPVSQEIKRHFTLVAAAMLQLTHAKWLYGCTGRNLDILAREPLWEIGLDYKCGTGHGVGYILNVHEGPQSLRWRYTGGNEALLEAGMDVTNEPGVYVEGSHGIRTENVMVVRNGEKNEYGQFMYFDTLTYVPIDREAIDPAYLTPLQRQYLNEYHRAVYEKIGPMLEDGERAWLKEATSEI